MLGMAALVVLHCGDVTARVSTGRREISDFLFATLLALLAVLRRAPRRRQSKVAVFEFFLYSSGLSTAGRWG